MNPMSESESGATDPLDASEGIVSLDDLLSEEFLVEVPGRYLVIRRRVSL